MGDKTMNKIWPLNSRSLLCIEVDCGIHTLSQYEADFANRYYNKNTVCLRKDRGPKNKVLVSEWILNCFDLMPLLTSFITLNNPNCSKPQFLHLEIEDNKRNHWIEDGQKNKQSVNIWCYS